MYVPLHVHVRVYMHAHGVAWEDHGHVSVHVHVHMYMHAHGVAGKDHGHGHGHVNVHEHTARYMLSFRDGAWAFRAAGQLAKRRVGQEGGAALAHMHMYMHLHTGQEVNWQAAEHGSRVGQGGWARSQLTSHMPFWRRQRQG